MTVKQAIARAVRERIGSPGVTQEIARSLRAIAEGRPLEAEPDEARRVRRVQAVTGLPRTTAEAVAEYRDLDRLSLNDGERTGAESIRGTTVDFLGTAFLMKGALASRAVGRIAFREGPGEGTGFLISPSLLLTNNHVIPSASAATKFLIEFDYELDLDRRPRPVTRFELSPQDFFLTDDRDDLDYTVVAVGARVEGAATLNQLGYCPLSGAGDKHALGEFVNIVQHPDARMKEIVVRENALVARGAVTLHYLADTEGGSSGSPVFNDQWEVVALHHWGVPHREVELPGGAPLRRDVNEGIRVSAIVGELSATLSRLTGRKRAMLEEALQIGAEGRVSPADREATQAHEAISKPHGMPSWAAPAVYQTSPRTVTWRVPIDISVTIGDGPDATNQFKVSPNDEPPRPVFDAAPTGPVSKAGPEKVRPAKNYRKRDGYRPEFLPGYRVEMPELGEANSDFAARNILAGADDDPHELKYTHFSVKLNGRRRLAFFTATNIDGEHWKSVNRDTGEVTAKTRGDDDENAGSEGRETWYEDPRVDDGLETNDDLYLHQRIDGRNPGQLRIFERGHLTRRQDPAWGSDEAALAADADTFHFTNCAPQIGFFNEGKSKRQEEARRGIGASGALHWRALEDYVLENAKAQDRLVTVFTGPVLNDAEDIPWRTELFEDFKVPREFWKVVVRVENDTLLATALCADQSPLIDQLPEARSTGFSDLSKVRKYQISIPDLETKTGLDFGADVRGADTFRPGAEGRRTYASIDDLSLDPPGGEAGPAKESGSSSNGKRRTESGRSRRKPPAP